MVSFPTRLGAAVDGILQELVTSGRRFDDSVNWSDLRCTLIEKVDMYCPKEGYQDTFWRVVISEASPHASKLCHYVRQELKRRQFETDKIEINTEW